MNLLKRAPKYAGFKTTRRDPDEGDKSVGAGCAFREGARGRTSSTDQILADHVLGWSVGTAKQKASRVGKHGLWSGRDSGLAERQLAECTE